MSDHFTLAEKARGLADLQECMDNIGVPRQTHKTTIDCLRLCANALDAANARADAAEERARTAQAVRPATCRRFCRVGVRVIG